MAWKVLAKYPCSRRPMFRPDSGLLANTWMTQMRPNWIVCISPLRTVQGKTMPTTACFHAFFPPLPTAQDRCITLRKKMEKSLTRTSFTLEWPKKQHVEAMESPGQPLDPQRAQKLCVSQWETRNLKDSERLCREQWLKISAVMCMNLGTDYENFLTAVLAHNSYSTKYYTMSSERLKSLKQSNLLENAFFFIFYLKLLKQTYHWIIVGSFLGKWLKWWL